MFGKIGLFAVVMLMAAGCGRRAEATAGSIPPSANALTHYTLEVVHEYPHARDAFTQGLLFWNGSLLESTGLVGQSRLREVDWPTGRIMKEVSVRPPYFAEGLTVLGDKAYQLTWRSHKGFIYDAATFQALGEFAYEGEGWGLTTDGKSLIMSDGTNRIRYLDPATFAVIRTLVVTEDGTPVDQLNELEYIRGEIFANVWQTNRIVRVDTNTGRVRGEIDCSGLLSPEDQANTDVLNGIAYDAAADRLVLTGKLWPKLFEVRLKVVTSGRGAELK